MLGALVWAVPVGIGCVVGGGALAGSDAPGVLTWLAWVLALGVVAVGGVAAPLLRWRTWRTTPCAIRGCCPCSKSSPWMTRRRRCERRPGGCCVA